MKNIEKSGREASKEIVEEGVLRKLQSKLMRIAFAGFITLSGAMGESYADQVRVAKKEGKSPQFSLETAITDERLEMFERRLKLEEPGFIKWLDQYVSELLSRIKGVNEYVPTTSLEDDAENDSHLRVALEDSLRSFSDEKKREIQELFESQIKKDHEIIKVLKSNPELTNRIVDFFSKNLKKIILSVVYLEGSPEIRKNMIKFLEPPEFTYSAHRVNRIFEDVLASTSAGESNGKYRVVIALSPGSFSTYDGKFNLSVYINTLTHELIHALNPTFNPSSHETGEDNSPLRMFFEEGLTQNLTLETIQYLSLREKEIRPSVGCHDYDQRLITSAILEGIVKTSQYKNLLSLWRSGVIGDDTMLLHLKEAFRSLGLDEGVSQDLSILNQDVTAKEYRNLSSSTLANLLSRLKISGVELSPEFLKSILSRNRLLEDWQIKSLDKTVSQGLIDSVKIKN